VKYELLIRRLQQQTRNVARSSNGRITQVKFPTMTL
jgi:hypothetical protein